MTGHAEKIETKGLKKKGGSNYNANLHGQENDLLNEAIPLLCPLSMNLVRGGTKSQSGPHTSTFPPFRTAPASDNPTPSACIILSDLGFVCLHDLPFLSRSSDSRRVPLRTDDVLTSNLFSTP